MTNEPYEYRGVKGLQNIADFVGIEYTTLKNRVSGRNKMSLAEAISKGRNVNVKHTYQGVEGIANIVNTFGEAYGVTKSAVENRLARGWGIAKAVETPMTRKHKHFEKSEPNRKFVGIKFPTDLNPLWRLALGMKCNNEMLNA